MTTARPIPNEPLLLVEGRRRGLVAADLHIGIEHQLWLGGASVPSQTGKMLAGLRLRAEEVEPDRVILLGDVKHNLPWTSFQEKGEVPSFLKALSEVAKVEVIAGNHDNPQRLRAIKPILEAGCGVHVGATVARPAEGGVVTVRTRGGEVASLALLPFLSQRQIVRAVDLMERDADEHGQAYAERFSAIAAHLTAALDPKAVRIL
ncbi:MAG TPA: metallophosphoesterase, partial [Methanothrix sp.]|nr:metallophosphoesterase [Methanothrix sp.]